LQEGKASNEKTKFLIFVYSTHKLHNEVRFEGDVCSMQGQAAPAVTDVIRVSLFHNRLPFQCFFAVGSVKFLQLSFL